MSFKLSVTCCKKDPRTGTISSVCISDFEVEQSVVDDAPALQAAVRYLQAAANAGVDAYLASQGVAPPGHWDGRICNRYSKRVGLCAGLGSAP